MKQLLTVMGLLTAITPFMLIGCGSRSVSSIDGKVIDVNGFPLANVTVKANQIEAIKGYEAVQADTDKEGVFTLRGMFPQSKYVITIEGEKWIAARCDTIESGPAEETKLLTVPLAVDLAVTREGSLVIDLETGTSRFEKTTEGYIDDTETNLEWYIFQETMNWFDASSSISSLGNGWRLPTLNELRKLYVKGLGVHNIDPLFGINDKAQGCTVWSNDLTRLPFGLNVSIGFNFEWGKETHRPGSRAGLNADHTSQVSFAVRNLEGPEIERQSVPEASSQSPEQVVRIKTIADLGPPPAIAKKPSVNAPVEVERVSRELPLPPTVDVKSADQLQEDPEIKIDEEEVLPSPDEFIPVEITAEMIYEHPPEYPRLAQTAGVKAVVWVKALVDKNGNVRNAMVLKSSGSKAGFDEAALKAAYKCKFTPAIQNGRPVAVWVGYQVEFSMSDTK